MFTLFDTVQFQPRVLVLINQSINGRDIIVTIEIWLHCFVIDFLSPFSTISLNCCYKNLLLVKLYAEKLHLKFQKRRKRAFQYYYVFSNQFS